ncbi:MAG: undecaprenyl-diphosphate phosphatase [Deltaproteobacteria bacterium]|nr:undecaprenyl-diphosphate phosphatase [Deltaproteobacteria bacterium]
MSWIEVMALGALQGVTEFLPVSSSGHLALAEHLFGVHHPQTLFDLCLHLGTLVAVIGFFMAPLKDTLTGTIAWIGSIARGQTPSADQTSSARVAGLVLVGSVPAGIVGLVWGHRLEAWATDSSVVGVLLILNGIMLLSTLPALLEWTKTRPVARLSVVGALLIGVAQSLAILRGVSRSGSTISAARQMGLSAVDSARFSFFLFIPAIIGALLLEMSHGWPEGVSLGPTQALVGGIVAMITGVLALKLLMRVLRAGRLYWFGPYCIAIGLVTLLTQ